MKIHPNAQPKGIALVIVMIVIVVLGILAGGFAYSMKVETRLARNTNFETDLEWMGRSGVDFARYFLVQSMNVPNEPFDALSQKWAGGPLGTNEVLESLSLEDNHLGVGTFSVKIIDLERKFNINSINQGNAFILQRALGLAGADPSETSPILDAFLDWIDLDQNPRLSGAESNDYMSQPNPGYPPYVAKNGPIDDLSELLLIRGITPEMYWGPGGNHSTQTSSEGESSTGLAGLFTAMSSGVINVNTASAQVLQLIPGIDPTLVQGIIRTRAGWDGVDGTYDDVPYRTVGDLINVPGIPREVIPQLQGFFTTRSLTFEVHVEAKINQYKRRFVAVLRRNPANLRDVRTLYFHWK
jgi:general secretion pathway protein K